MKYLTWAIAFLIVAILNTVFKNLDIAYSLAVMLSPDDLDKMAVLTGLFSGLFAAATYGCAFYFARKINKHRKTGKKTKSKEASTVLSPGSEQTVTVTSTTESPSEVNAAKTPSKQRYCKFCGGAIDNQSKKCTNCGKQYFRITRTGIIACCMCVLVLLLVGVIAGQYNHYENDILELNNQIAELEQDIQTKSISERSNVRKIEKLQEQIDFYEEHVVFVINDGTSFYHKLNCRYLEQASFWAYNTELAESKGYSPCSKCCD